MKFENRVECGKIRLDVEKTKETEKVLELDALNRLKEEEIMNLKNIWQTKITELLEEVSLCFYYLAEK